MSNEIKKVCIISAGYPSENNPVYTFVDQFVSELADNGIDCSVIAPISVTNSLLRRNGMEPSYSTKTTKNGNEIKIYRPRYISYSKNISFFNTTMYTYRNFKKSVFKIIKETNLNPDIVYGHFIAPSGIVASELGEYLNVPSFIAFGESSTKMFEDYNAGFLKRRLSKISGVIAVSSENKRRLIDTNFIKENKIGVFPNAINNELFYKRDITEMRSKYNYSSDDFIAIFVGSFIHRKGPHRVTKALNNIEGVKTIFIGNGPQIPTGENILHAGKMTHEKIPELLSAADVFVLPTLNEGCCNAIIEAMACGLPIVSSDKPFNDDILWENNSIRVDPLNIEDIKNAVKTLKNDKDRMRSMSKASLKHSEKLRINVRVKNIIHFMNEKSGFYKEGI